MTDTARKRVRSAREKQSFQGVFEVACEVLNGGPIPRRSSERFVMPADGTSQWGHRGWGTGTFSQVRQRFSRRIGARMGLQNTQPRDVTDLRDRIAAKLRLFGQSPARGGQFFDHALPTVRSIWIAALNPMVGRKVIPPTLYAFYDIFIEMAEDFGSDYAWQFVRSLGAAPKTERTLEETYLCLLVAFHFLQEGGFSKQRLAPCLACTRFFVTTRSNRETCSDSCRQRYYRGGQDDEGKTALRTKAAEYQRKHRAKSRPSLTNETALTPTPR